MRSVRLWFARARLRRVHEAIGEHDNYVAVASMTRARLIAAERAARSELFALEHPRLLRNRPSTVYGITPSAPAARNYTKGLK